MNIWPRQSESKTFYGDPDANHDGRADPAWESVNLTKIAPPWRMVLAWAPTQVVRGIWIHKKCAASLSTVLLATWEHYGRDQRAIEDARMHLYGGAYNFRLTRGGTTLSQHSYACAIDLDPEHNGLGRKWIANTHMMPQPVIDAFRTEGWTWGGEWDRPDPMHFQAARVA